MAPLAEVALPGAAAFVPVVPADVVLEVPVGSDAVGDALSVLTLSPPDTLADEVDVEAAGSVADVAVDEALNAAGAAAVLVLLVVVLLVVVLLVVVLLVVVLGRAGSCVPATNPL
jgi:hypothetical protein